MITKKYCVLSAVYCGVLLISNILANKVIMPFGYVLPCAVILFPVVYILSDLMTEVYGLKLSKIAIKTNTCMNLFMSLIFILAVILSEIMLIILGTSINYINDDGELTTVKFGMANIKQMIIIIFVFVLMIVLSFKIKSKQEIKDLLKVFGISSIFAIIWGFIQFFMYYLKIPYPAFLFNNNEFAAQLYNQADNGIKRINSIALEPSMFSINLIAFIPFIIGTFFTLKRDFKNIKYVQVLVIAIIATVCTILTTSSTAYVGLVTAYGLFGLYILFGFIKNGELSNRKKNFVKLFAIAVISISIAAVICIVAVKIGNKIDNTQNNPIEITQPEEKPDLDEDETSGINRLITTLKQMTINKLSSNSGKERMSREITGFDMFKCSPVFGIGFGSYRTFSLLTNILLGSGVFGMCAFIYIIYVVCKELIKYRKKEETISITFIISIIATTMCFFAGVPDFIFIYYWMIIVLGYKYATLEN